MRSKKFPLILRRTGGKTWIEKNALLYDTFTTADAAPITSPRTCEPGPGTLIVANTNNKLSISGGALVHATDTSYAGVSGNASLTRAAGISAFTSQLTADNNQQWLGLEQNTDAGNVIGGEYINGGTTLEVVKGGSGTVDFSDTDAAPHIFGITLRPNGCFYVWDGKLVWADDVGVGAAYVYPQLNARIGNSTYDWLWAGQLATYDSSWSGDWTEVTDSETNPATATAFNCNADFHLNATFTYEAGKDITFVFREKTQNTDYVALYIASSTRIQVVKEVDNSLSTLVIGSIGDVVDGTAYEFDIVGLGSSLKFYKNKVLLYDVTETSHMTETGGRVSQNLATNDIVLTTHPYPALGIATSRVVCPQDEDTFTHTADFVAEIKNVVLPAADNLSFQFRISGSDELTLNIASDGSIALLDNATSRISGGAASVSDDDDVVLICDGANGEIFVNGTSVGTSAAIAHLTGTSGKRDDSTTGDADHIACFPRDVTDLLPKGLY